MLESLSDNGKGLQVVRLATLFKERPRAGVSDPTVCRISTK